MIQLKSAGEIKQKIARVPKIIYFISAGVLLVAAYVFSFILPRTIEFSYAGDNCRTALVFLPNQQKTSGDPSFTLEYQKKIAGAFATQLCVKPVAAPEKGERAVQSSPFGWPLFQSNYQIKVTEPPQVVGSQTNAPIAIKNRLSSLSTSPTIYLTTQLALATTLKVAAPNQALLSVE